MTDKKELIPHLTRKEKKEMGKQRRVSSGADPPKPEDPPPKMPWWVPLWAMISEMMGGTLAFTVLALFWAWIHYLVKWIDGLGVDGLTMTTLSGLEIFTLIMDAVLYVYFSVMAAWKFIKTISAG